DPPADGRAIGVVTDRDLVLQAMSKGLSASTPVGEVMSGDPQTVARNADIHDAICLMRLGGFRRLAVVDEREEIVGMLSLDDVIQAMASDLVSVASLIQVEREREH